MDPSESRNRVRIAVLLFLVVAGYYWKLTLRRQFEWMTGNWSRDTVKERQV